MKKGFAAFFRPDMSQASSSFLKVVWIKVRKTRRSIIFYKFLHGFTSKVKD